MSFLFGSRKEKVRAPDELVKLIDEAFETLAATTVRTETGNQNSASSVGAGSAAVGSAGHVDATSVSSGGARGGAAETSSSGGNALVSRRAAGKVLKAEARAIEDLSRYLHQLKVALYGDNSDSEHYKPAGEELAGVRNECMNMKHERERERVSESVFGAHTTSPISVA